MLADIPPDLGLKISKPPNRCVDQWSKDFKARIDVTANPLISRVDLHQKLLGIYEGEKARWVQYKIDAQPADDFKQPETDAYYSEKPDAP